MRDFDAMWDYQQPDQTEQRFRARYGEIKDSESCGYRAELLTQIARSLGLQQKFEEAEAVLDEAQALLADSPPSTAIRCLLERGRVYNSSSRQPESLPCFVAAWELGLESGEDDYAVDAAHMLGIAEPAADKRAEWNDKALRLAESSPAASRWLGSLYNNVGWAKVEAGELEEALELFRKALSFRLEQGSPKPIAIARWCEAKVLRLLGRADEAYPIQLDLLKHRDAADPDGYVYEELGECLLALGRSHEAAECFGEAHSLLSRDRWFSEPERLERLKRLSLAEP